jgi:hypothetical protein
MPVESSFSNLRRGTKALVVVAASTVALIGVRRRSSSPRACVIRDEPERIDEHF